MSASWTYLTVQFTDGGGLTARQKGTALALQIGANFDADGNPETGSENYCLSGPWVQWLVRPVEGRDDSGARAVLVPGQADAGEWWTIGLNPAWPGHDGALAALQAAGVVRLPSTPSNVYAGE
jgi:hypothetical protein